MSKQQPFATWYFNHNSLVIHDKEKPLKQMQKWAEKRKIKGSKLSKPLFKGLLHCLQIPCNNKELAAEIHAAYDLLKGEL